MRKALNTFVEVSLTFEPLKTSCQQLLKVQLSWQWWITLLVRIPSSVEEGHLHQHPFFQSCIAAASQPHLHDFRAELWLTVECVKCCTLLRVNFWPLQAKAGQAFLDQSEIKSSEPVLLFSNQPLYHKNFFLMLLELPVTMSEIPKH